MNGLLAKPAWKIPKSNGKDFSSSWNTLTIHLLAPWNDHLLTFVPNNVHENKIFMNDERLFATHAGNVWGICEVAYHIAQNFGGRKLWRNWNC